MIHDYWVVFVFMNLLVKCRPADDMYILLTKCKGCTGRI